MDERPQVVHCVASHEQGKCRRRDALRLAWWYGRGCYPLYIVSSIAGIEVRSTLYDDSFILKYFFLSYLHINGFIHRDIKAANLLIDDDGTVLLGDLGVAANLAEDTSQLHGTSISRPESSAQQTDNGHGNLAAKRVVLFDHTVPVVERPRMGKRKSFVGTVCFSSGSNACYILSCGLSPGGWLQN